MKNLNLDRLRELRGKAYSVGMKQRDKLRSQDVVSVNDMDLLAELELLLSQYNWGVMAKNKLLELCINNKWIDPDKD